MKNIINVVTIIVLTTTIGLCQWFDAGTSVFLNNSSDNVGIGTSAPGSNKLKILGADNNGSYAALNISTGSQNMLLDGNEIDCISGGLYLQNNTGSNIAMVTGGGYVGIGTSSPGTNKLKIVGGDNTGSSAALNVTAGSQTMLIDGNEIDALSGPLYLQYNSQNDISMVRNGGRVGIGTAAPSSALHVYDDAAYNAIQFKLQQAASDGGSLFTLESSSAWSHVYLGAAQRDLHIAVNASNVDIARNFIFSEEPLFGIGIVPEHPIDVSNGAYLSSGGVWTNASSRELKENIQELASLDAQATLAELKPVTYRYRSDQQESHVGFIAEDVPDLVATTDRKGIASMDIVAVLTRVVQDQQAMIEQLTARLDALDGGATSTDGTSSSIQLIQNARQDAGHFGDEASAEVASQNLLAVPADFVLSHNYPNPFNPTTTIEYGLPRADSIQLTIFDITGRVVKSAVSSLQSAGYHVYLWDGTDDFGNAVASGTYLYQLQSSDEVHTRKMTLAR